MVIEAITGAVAAMMGNSKKPSAPSESNSHHERMSNGDFTSHGRQGVRKRAEDRPGSAQAHEYALPEDVFAEHEQNLQQQQSLNTDLSLKYNKLKSAYRNLKLEHEKNREDNVELADLCRHLSEERSNLKEQCKEVQERCDNLLAHYEYAHNRYKYLVDKVVQPYAQIKGLHWNGQTQDTIDVVLDPLAIDAVEASGLRGQVRALQKEMLARVEKTEAVADEQFAQEIRNLTALIKTLSRTVRPVEQANIFEVLGTPVLLHDVAQHHWNTRARKKCLIEAWTWSVLLDMVFRTPFTIFGERCEIVRRAWSTMFGAEHYHNWPSPSVVCETWRYTTMERLVGCVLGSAIITQGITKDDYNVLEASVMEARDTTFHTITSVLTSISPTTDFSDVGQIVNKAFALAMQLSFQRARLQITYPQVKADFNRCTMSSMPDPDGKDINDGLVTFIVNPGLTKWGDAHGKNLDQRYDIVPSLVQLEPAAMNDDHEISLI